MSLFGRDPKSSSPPAPSSSPSPAAPQRPPQAARGAPQAATHIAPGSKVVGRVTGSAELVIDGELEGEIDLDSQVVVGERGRVKGQIQARSVQVAGKVHGNIRGHERVEVLASGGLEGDVVSPRVVIAEGAFFKGKVEMTEPRAKGGAAAKAPGQPKGEQPKGEQPAPQPAKGGQAPIPQGQGQRKPV